MNEIPQLTQEEIRVLGALLEKSKTTPDYYPLTLNALQLACNQKSSRNPVVEYDEETILVTIDALKKKHLCANVIGGGSRSLKYRQTLAVNFPLDPAETSVLCLLFLRGPLTAGEIKTNAARLHDFDSLQEVQNTLENLANYEMPFVTLLPKKAGQKEGRYFHCFAALSDSQENDLDARKTSESNSELENRIERVEIELKELQEKFDQLMKELMG